MQWRERPTTQLFTHASRWTSNWDALAKRLPTDDPMVRFLRAERPPPWTAVRRNVPRAPYRGSCGWSGSRMKDALALLLAHLHQATAGVSLAPIWSDRFKIDRRIGGCRVGMVGREVRCSIASVSLRMGWKNRRSKRSIATRLTRHAMCSDGEVKHEGWDACSFAAGRQKAGRCVA